MKKGTVVYQQIELTTAEWQVNDTVYPPSIWLFERLESGRFNMKLSDGVHEFSELPAVMQEIGVKVIENKADSYILRFTTVDGTFDTPNLMGQDVKVKVKTNTASEYILEITTSAGVITTPNLKSGSSGYVPTLGAAPSDGTLTYTDSSGATVAFTIGQMCRVADAENECGYTFYQLYDLTSDGKAVWAVSGGASDLRETVRINLTSNQSQPDSSLTGATIKVTGTDGTEFFDGVWNGTEVKVKVTALKEYTITAGGINGYATPPASTLTAELQGERNVSFAYNTCVLTVNITGLESGETTTATVSYDDKQFTLDSGDSLKVPFGTEVTVTASEVTGYATPSARKFTPSQAAQSVLIEYVPSSVKVMIDSNQPDKAPLEGLKATLTYNGGSVQVSSGVVTRIPLGTEVAVSFPGLPGYKKPDDMTLTTVAGVTEKTGVYRTEAVLITVSSDDSVPVSGVVITVKDNNGTVTASGSGTLSVNIPYGAQYTVSVPARDGYTTPAAQTFTAAQASRNIGMAYVYNPIIYSYITINQTITDPATMISGDVNGAAIQAIRQNSHRVLGKYAGGQMTVCRLDDVNGNQYHDGTAAVLTGAQGDVFMRLPQFYYKATETSADVWKIGFAYGGQPDGTWKEWDGNDLIGVYEAYLSSSKMYSRSGVTPTVNVSQADFKTQARNRGNGYTIVKHKHQNILAFLFYAMYGHTNCQSKCGSGTSSNAKVTGATDALGMENTVAGGNGDSNSINFWGLENWWGDLYEWEDNVAIDSYVWKVTEDDGTVRTCPAAATSDGYIKKMQIGEHLDTICKVAGGSDSTGFCDYYYQTNGARVVARSCIGSSTFGGVAFAYANSDASSAGSYIGSRLAFRGVLVEAESVAAFKAIAVSN